VVLGVHSSELAKGEELDLCPISDEKKEGVLTRHSNPNAGNGLKNDPQIFIGSIHHPANMAMMASSHQQNNKKTTATMKGANAQVKRFITFSLISPN